MADIPVFVDSDDTSSERRVSPDWSVSTLKQKMWPITGIPPDYQIITFPAQSSASSITDDTLLSSLSLSPYTAVKITDSRPPAQRPNYTDDTHVDKYELTSEEYASRSDSVLAYKRRHQLGRFNPDLVARESAALSDLATSGYVVGARCRVTGEADRRGVVRFVGPVVQIPAGGIWIGVEYDEPVGKNDGSLDGTRYFQCPPKHGGFLRPGKVEVGDYPPKDLEDEFMDSDADEI